MKVLLVEDNLTLLSSLAMAFEMWGYQVDSSSDGNEAIYKGLSQSYDIMVLDVNLPSASGFEIIKTLRKNQIDTPVLFLTARDTLNDKLEGFHSGGDDYLVKPFDLDELAVRIQALIKRSAPVKESVLSLKDIALDMEKNTALVKETALTLTSKELQILEYLLINQDHVVSQEQISRRIWDIEHTAESNAIGVHLHNLRKKMMDAGSEAHIVTVRGLGYKLT